MIYKKNGRHMNLVNRHVFTVFVCLVINWYCYQLLTWLKQIPSGVVLEHGHDVPPPPAPTSDPKFGGEGGSSFAFILLFGAKRFVCRFCFA